MSFDDFCKCDFDEFESICKAWKESREAEYRDGWERMRLSAAIAIQPHVKKKITPRQLLRLPWDKNSLTRSEEAPTLSAEEKRIRFEEVVQRLGDEINR